MKTYIKKYFYLLINQPKKESFSSDYTCKIFYRPHTKAIILNELAQPFSAAKAENKAKLT